MLKSKTKALRHFKAHPVLNIDETIYKQGESMGSRDPYVFICLIQELWDSV